MSLNFQEEQLTAGSYKVIKLQDLEKGDFITFFTCGTESRSSAEYGDFEVVVGLEVDTNARSVSELVETAEPASFVPNTMLQNLGLKSGTLYKIQKEWNRGDKGPKGKPSKGYGYKVFKLSADLEVLNKLDEKFAQSQNSSPFGDATAVQAKPGKPRL